MINKSKFSLEKARQLDKQDILSSFRNEFFFPKKNNKNLLYFSGNSLGLQPKIVSKYIQSELDDWANLGVEGHFLAKNPWLTYHKILTNQSAELVGAKKNEVVVMNALTTNIHLLLMSFYRPTKRKYKILCEANAFPSDLYALQSQVELHGYSFDEAVVLIETDKNGVVSHDNLYKMIYDLGDELALVFLGGVNYYSGQVFDMKEITRVGHEVGAVVGFDLAHAAGNISLSLHKWQVDFATWCSYKYLNSGPGNVSGVFVHQNQSKKKPFRLSGWWGSSEKNRFVYDTKKRFQVQNGAEGWQLSNAPVLGMASHKASLDIFSKAGFSNLIEKSKLLTSCLEEVFLDFNKLSNDIQLSIITPKKPIDPGCQLSISVNHSGKKIYNYLKENGVIVDWREPNVIRFAPVPLYNSFEDIYKLSKILLNAI